MTRIPITQGVKERVSANAGRLLAGFNPHDKPSEAAIAGAIRWATEIERQVTAALTPEEDGA